MTDFIGREAQLGGISSLFSTNPGDNRPQILILHALGGQGKSQLALEYCWSFQKIYGGIFWINASSELLVLQSYAQIGTALGIASSTVLEEKDHMIGLVKDYLEGWSQRWLLVFDNYDEPQRFPKIHQFIPRCKCSAVTRLYLLRIDSSNNDVDSWTRPCDYHKS